MVPLPPFLCFLRPRHPRLTCAWLFFPFLLCVWPAAPSPSSSASLLLSPETSDDTTSPAGKDALSMSSRRRWEHQEDLGEGVVDLRDINTQPLRLIGMFVGLFVGDYSLWKCLVVG